MSFKYRFIVSFVLLEAFFILLIVSVNFIAINNSSNKLIKEKIDSTISFFDELIKVPISIYDIATLDNLITKTKKLTYINSVVVLDSQDRVLSKEYEFKHLKLENLFDVKTSYKYEFEDEVYEIVYKKVYEEGTFLGTVYVIFDISDDKQFIENNKSNTIFIIIIEILLSTILSYFIGSRLTNMLTNLSLAAEEIGKNKQPNIPYKDKKDEIGILANSMNQMQGDLKQRNEKLKELARVLNTQKNELIEAHKDKDDFLANMSHELKTPLNSINVISSVMMKNKDGSLSDKQVKNLSIINNCGNDLLYLINDILDISKIEAGELKLNYSNMDINVLIEETYHMFKPISKEKELAFELNINTENKIIFSDANRIKQIIKNLLSNAFKFTSKGEVLLDVSEDEEFIKILVKDSGIGIEQNKLEHIFDRFKQADGSTTRKFGGTGLGLSISKELSRLLGGEITVESIINEGTTFTVSIAKNLDKVVIEEKLQVSDEVVENEKNKVLVYNSNPITFMNLVVNLKKFNEVKQFNNYEEFIENFLNEIYDFIVIDFDSVIDCSQIKDFSKTVAICENKETLDKDISDKCLLCIEKPINLDELNKVIKIY